MRFPALALLTLGLAAPAAAQTPIVRVSFASPPARVVSRPVFAQGQPNPTKKPPQKDPIFSWKDHPMLTFGIVEIAFRARLQFDHEATDESIELEEDVNRGLDLSRGRIGIAGQVRPLRRVPSRIRSAGRRGIRGGMCKSPTRSSTKCSFVSGSSSCRSAWTRTPARRTSTSCTGRSPPARWRRDATGWMVHGRVSRDLPL